MNVEKYKKLVEMDFIRVDEFEFRSDNLFETLHILNQTMENDKYGEYSVRGYELPDSYTIESLIKLDLVKNYTGPRMADCYCIKDKDKFDKFYEEINNLYYKSS